MVSLHIASFSASPPFFFTNLMTAMQRLFQGFCLHRFKQAHPLQSNLNQAVGDKLK
jgi:hypothetical protein